MYANKPNKNCKKPWSTFLAPWRTFLAPWRTFLAPWRTFWHHDAHFWQHDIHFWHNDAHFWHHDAHFMAPWRIFSGLWHTFLAPWRTFSAFWMIVNCFWPFWPYWPFLTVYHKHTRGSIVGRMWHFFTPPLGDLGELSAFFIASITFGKQRNLFVNFYKFGTILILKDFKLHHRFKSLYCNILQYMYMPIAIFLDQVVELHQEGPMRLLSLVSLQSLPS